MRQDRQQLEDSLRALHPMYDTARTVFARLMLAGDDGSWAGETDAVKVTMLQIGVIAQALEDVTRNAVDINTNHRMKKLFEYFDDKETSARRAAHAYPGIAPKLLAEADAYQDAAEMVAEEMLTTDEKFAALEAAKG